MSKYEWVEVTNREDYKINLLFTMPIALSIVMILTILSLPALSH